MSKASSSRYTHILSDGKPPAKPELVAGVKDRARHSIAIGPFKIFSVQTFLSSSHIATRDAFPEHWRHDEENGVSESNNNLNENALLGDDMLTSHQEDYLDPLWDEGVNPCVPSKSSRAGNERTPLLRRVPSQQMSERFVNGKNHLLLRKTSTLSVASKQPEYYFEPGRSTYRQTLFNSTAILLGVGMLSEPLAFALAGWIPGFILIVFYGFITCYTAKILARIIREDPNLRTYADIALKAFGRRSRVFTGLLFFLELFSVCVILVTLCGDSLHLVLPTFTSNQYKPMTIIALAPAMFLPLSILAYASLLGVLSTFSIMGCIMIDGLSKPDAPGSLWEPADTMLYGRDTRKIGVAFGLFMAGFGGHAVIPSLARDMQDPSEFDGMINWAFAIATFLYGVIGAAGYLMFGESVGEEISKNILEVPEYNRFLNNLTVWMLVFAPLTKFPLNMRPLSLTIEAWLGLDNLNPIQPHQNGGPPSPSERTARLLETSPRTSRHPIPLSDVQPSYSHISSIEESSVDMISSEELFKSTELDVLVPREVYDIPDEADEDWLCSITEGDGQRGTAYFGELITDSNMMFCSSSFASLKDERLVLFFCVKIPPINEEPPNAKAPPRELASFLLHLQITLDAKYIPAHANSNNRQTVRNAGLSLHLPPPRSESYQKNTQTQANGLSIFPPNTPNPTPTTGEADRVYARSNSAEGTILESYVWGDTARDEPPGRNFALLWAVSQKRWIAVYRMTLGIAFLRTTFHDPLLSLTASTTLREKALAITPDRKTLFDTLRLGETQSRSLNATGITIMEDLDNQPNGRLHGLQEANLLGGLTLGELQYLFHHSNVFDFKGIYIGPIRSLENPDKLTFPTSRLSSTFRRAAFSLPPATPMTHPLTTPATIANTQSTTPILRKSFLKVLQTLTGFQIRMKSVSVPYVIIPETLENERERWAAGSEERTIVLSVEITYGDITNGSKSKSSGFVIEDVEVSVGGEGANSYLLRWDRDGVQDTKLIFPLFISSADQFNLLYAIRFWRQSDADDIADALRSGVNGDLHPTFQLDLQRPVAIIVHGRPFDVMHPDDLNTINHQKETSRVRYNAQRFRSRWNCILDLSNQSDSVPEPHSPQDALPTPATPFPTVNSVAKRLLERRLGLDKRHTIGEVALPSPRLNSSLTHPYRSSTSMLKSSVKIQSPSSAVNGRANTPPSVFVKGHSRIPSTTAITNIPSAQPSPTSPENEHPPITPAYPSYPTDVFPMTPVAQSPIANFRASASHFVESHREGGLTTLISPLTHAPAKENYMSERSPPIIVSIGLLRSGGDHLSDTIYPLDVFSLEIFIFNKSERTRRLEVSHYEHGRHKHSMSMQLGTNVDSSSKLKKPPGLIPLENRVRVGPLRPHTCQSVTMRFLALRPGVHPISSLTLTDVETDFSKNLKSVMDVVIHEPVKSSRLLHVEL
ncbi:hypothetical protein Clacol_002981 [Clathrus columnatus]|uniref:Amino acid transporter transmembrane domain-containing protein n=1 Tax=Clathrus columnatus TaxID=1419009 RepID=A0AAV5A2A1_9AGAM|nr:hypothetical protein Clacol_002981 [Clathrus columnatus]